ncbi:hypothetical protein B0H16DRAFT_520000 [Mycena metata]|uniref:Alkyl hydroperoxide reductase subunit C/ Thiol specific antioxidant domain-containing protein n=1 Tax=Mycena metata TaxID=1033252 RepID=A0AAD7H842_9AGAR|nr:hypothetical protein B0H16DRAFT_520000 [Mycena metata]
MTLRQELKSFWPEGKPALAAPVIGLKAPSSERLPIPSVDGRPVILTFLRHCGCPFAEKTFKAIRTTAAHNPNIRFIAVSHSDQGSTDRWVDAVGGGEGVEIVVDADREIFAEWGLGLSSLGHFMSPAGLWAVYRLGKDEGIWNKPTESGNRWQTSGSFAVDMRGTLRWGRAMRSVAEVPNFEEAVESVKVSSD